MLDSDMINSKDAKTESILAPEEKQSGKFKVKAKGFSLQK